MNTHNPMPSLAKAHPEVAQPVATLILCLAAFCGVSTISTMAVEPWADPRLGVTNGLALWYDASRQVAGRRAFELGPLVAGQPVDYLPDASGHGRHLSQAAPEYRPRFRQEPAGGTLRFDGTNDSLTAN